MRGRSWAAWLSLSILTLSLFLSLALTSAAAAETASEAMGDATPMPPMPAQVYLLYLEVLRDGQPIGAGPMLLHELGPHSSFASYDRKVSADAFFTLKFDALIWGSLADHYDDGLPEWSGPAEHSAHAVASRFRLGDICLDVYAPGSQMVRASAWRIDTAGKTPQELEALQGEPNIGDDSDANGIPDGPGDYLGTMTWAISSPDLGYIRDVEVTPEQLREMQFGVGQ